VFVLNKIRELNQGVTLNTFIGHLDLDKVGVFGHSFGGAVAGLTCLKDSRFKAGINMDGIQFGEYDYFANNIMLQPFMEMTSDDGVPGVNDFMFSHISNWTYRLHITGARHNNFTDIPMYVPVFRESTSISGGPIDPFRMKTIVDGYILAFFDKHLKGIDSQLLTETSGADAHPVSAFPEVSCQAHDPAR